MHKTKLYLSRLVQQQNQTPDNGMVGMVNAGALIIRIGFGGVYYTIIRIRRAGQNRAEKARQGTPETLF